MTHNHTLYTGSKNSIYVRDFHTGITTKIPQAHTERVSCLIPSKHNDRIFYSGSFDSTVKQWDIRKLETPTQQYSHKNGISCLYESNDGKKLYAGGADGLTSWDTNNPKSFSHIHSAYTVIDGTIKKVSLQYIDCITANDNESEMYIANLPTGITVLSPQYTIEELVKDLK
jgi:WD40 repeat protein